MKSNSPTPDSEEERAIWRQQQSRLPELFEALSADPRAPQTVIIIPSLSMDARELSKLKGVYHYEERMLVNLMLLQQPRTRLVYVTSLGGLLLLVAASWRSLIPRSQATRHAGLQ